MNLEPEVSLINNSEQDDEFATTLKDQESLFELPIDNNIQKSVVRKLVISAILATIFIILEIVGGLIANSLAILSDAAHMFTDVFGFLISIVSIFISQKKSSSVYTFGYHRAEVLGALTSIFLIFVMALLLYYEATTRIINKVYVKEPLAMLITAAVGLVFNLILAKILHTPTPGLAHQHCNNHHSTGENKHFSKQVHSETHTHGKTCEHNDTNHKHQHLQQEDILGQTAHNSSEKSQQKEESQHEHHNCQNQSEHFHHQQRYHQQSDLAASNATKTESSEPLLKVKLTLQKLLQAQGQQKAKLCQSLYNRRKRKLQHKISDDPCDCVGVLISSILIYTLGSREEWNNWNLLDPICTYLFSTIVVFTAIMICKDTLRVLLEGTPHGTNLEKIERKLKKIDNVIDVHELHVWALSAGKPSLSVHLVVDPGASTQRILYFATCICRKMGVYHTNIQIEENSKSFKIKCLNNIHL